VRRARTIAGVQAALEPLRRGSVGLVPTMGALHEGHRALFAAARRECDTVVASIFVNPAQFDDPADLEGYSINPEDDAQLAQDAGVDLLFVPTADEIYPEGFQTWVSVDELADILEGEHRPGHFRGVATVCTKLFAIVRPDRAYFGEKDAQQAAVVDRLVRDLALGLEVRVVPTVRDRDGLAVSSRNERLSPDERRAATALPRALSAGKLAYRRGEDAVEAARGILAEEPLLEPEYIEVAKFDGGAPILAAAVRAGRTRLIDNVSLEGVHDE
jgi:pantoate--beta-alanine ligase